MNFNRLLEPYPFVYRLPLAFTALLGLILYWSIQFNRVIIHDLEFIAPQMAINIGDSLAIPAFLIAAHMALRNHQYHRKRFYHHTLWYLVIGITATFTMVIIKVMRGFPLERELHFDQFIHDFLFVPFYSILIAGVLPHLILDIKGHIAIRVMAMMAFATYLTSFSFDLF